MNQAGESLARVGRRRTPKGCQGPAYPKLAEPEIGRCLCPDKALGYGHEVNHPKDPEERTPSGR